ncbi:MAG: RNB domain-containing ribonuclease, partial [Candidatus Paceibacterota bacterium]
MTNSKTPALPKKEKIFVDSEELEMPFPQAVLTEADDIAGQGQASIEAEITRSTSSGQANRRDFRDIFTVTIDPVRARDFDDALSLRALPDNQWEVGVHIADVSFYVRPGTALDREAQKRATSIYLIDRVLPMLPHALSDDLCSLKQGVDRLAFSAVFTMDNEANILNQWFGRTVINSNRRFTYEEVENIVKSDAVRSPTSSEPEVGLRSADNQFRTELIKLKDLAHKLDKKKIKAGALAFEEDEYHYEVDADGKPISIIKAERLESHKLVEDFMLLANKQVAEHVSKLIKNQDHQFVYRIHNRPDPEKLKDFFAFVKLFGHPSTALRVNKEKIITPLALNNFLKTLAGSPDEDVINDAAVRSMSRATYSTKNIGHFGLAFKHYTHFTSPIRRYPVLLVHRLFDYYLRKQAVPVELLQNLDHLCTNSSEREQFATIAERDSIKLAQCRYLEKRKDKTYDRLIAWM